MIDSLPEPTEEHPNPREEYVDGPLEVAVWGTRKADHTETVENAPAWWGGEEAASQSFFRAMGIDPANVHEGMGGSA